MFRIIFFFCRLSLFRVATVNHFTRFHFPSASSSVAPAPNISSFITSVYLLLIFMFSLSKQLPPYHRFPNVFLISANTKAISILHFQHAFLHYILIPSQFCQCAIESFYKCWIYIRPSLAWGQKDNLFYVGFKLYPSKNFADNNLWTGSECCVVQSNSRYQKTPSSVW